MAFLYDELAALVSSGVLNDKLVGKLSQYIASFHDPIEVMRCLLVVCVLPDWLKEVSWNCS